MNNLDVRLGDYRDVLSDVRAEAIITDPPFSARTHEGHQDQHHEDGYDRRRISYSAWAPDDAREFATWCHERCDGWIVIMTDHVLWPYYEKTLESMGRYVFSPIPHVHWGGRVRMAGDGPSSWAVYLVVSRPKGRPYSKWGTLPGAYLTRASNDRAIHIGGKPLSFVREVVRDYTKPGDLVMDPCAGAGTTLHACRIEGRRAIGSEIDPDTYEIARGVVDGMGKPTPLLSMMGE